jgi:hypothetical protein
MAHAHLECNNTLPGTICNEQSLILDERDGIKSTALPGNRPKER